MIKYFQPVKHHRFLKIAHRFQPLDTVSYCHSVSIEVFSRVARSRLTKFLHVMGSCYKIRKCFKSHGISSYTTSIYTTVYSFLLSNFSICMTTTPHRYICGVSSIYLTNSSSQAGIPRVLHVRTSKIIECKPMYHLPAWSQTVCFNQKYPTEQSGKANYVHIG